MGSTGRLPVAESAGKGAAGVADLLTALALGGMLRGELVGVEGVECR